MKKIYLFLLAICFSFSSFSQTGMLDGTGYAPDFTVTDINGTSHTLYNYLDSGFVVVLELLSTTCGHCIAYAPGTENSYQTNGPNGSNAARFLGLEVNASTDSADIANFMLTYGVTFPIANDVSPVGINYQLYYTPSYFVVYPDSSYTTLCPAYCVTTSSYSSIENQLNTAIAAWIPPVYGCMDSTALNYDPLVTIDDGSCDYSSYTINTVGMTFSPDTIICDVGDTINFLLGGYHNAVEVSDSTWIANGTTPLSGGFSFGYGSSGFYVPTGSNTFYYVCQPHVSMGMKGVIIANDFSVSGCTDSLAFNYDSLATVDDGSCSYCLSLNATPSNLSANWTTDSKAQISWDNMNDSCNMVWKYYVRYREIGIPTWTTKSAGVGNGLCNFGLNTSNKTLQNLTSGTTYEYKMKAFYCGGTESGYSSPSQFTTATDCPDMSNLSVQTFSGNQSKATFSWDTTGSYVFARVALRVDTAGANWQTAGGFGVYFPTLSVNKFGLQSGESYRAQGRTFCDSNITSYRSWWTSPVFWTQPGSIRMSGGSMINNLDVYPNPTNGIFNISFVSEEIQTLQLRVLNIVGEVVYTESLEKFVGEYTKQMSFGKNTKGVYILEVTDNQGSSIKKITIR